MVSLPFTMHCLNYVFNTVPSGPPTNVRYIEISPTAIVLLWDPPAYEEQNGKIANYVVKVINNQTGETSQMMIPGNPELESVSIGLKPYRTYMIMVAAATQVDIGPFSDPIIITTPEECKS